LITQTAQRTLRVLRRLLGVQPRDASENDTEKTADWYDRLFDQSTVYKQPYYQSYYYPLWAVIADRLRRDGIRRVLEIGCGSGQLAALLLEQGIDEYVGLDFSSVAIARARSNLPAGRFVIGDARTTRLHSEVEHDVVICTEVLEHIEDDLATLSRFTPGRRCICSVPNFAYPSHVRYFRDADEVKARYGLLFNELDVMTIRSPNSTREEVAQFFLADGVRNSYTVESSPGSLAVGIVAPRAAMLAVAESPPVRRVS
jgi:SAM-dependent methyltransferase